MTRIQRAVMAELWLAAVVDKAVEHGLLDDVAQRIERSRILHAVGYQALITVA